MLVSAFFPSGNVSHGLDMYITRGQELIDLPVRKIVYLPQSICERLRFNNDHTTVVVRDQNVAVDCAREHELPRARNKQKDTANYLHIMNLKTGFVADAISRFGTDQNYVWVDFGLLRLCSAQSVVDMTRERHSHVRIASIWDLRDVRFSLDSVMWYFAGGVFGGDARKLLAFHDACSETTAELRPHRVWEVNVWAIVYCRHPHLFDAYKCDHNASITANYLA